jgi:uncharacterized protein
MDGGNTGAEGLWLPTPEVDAALRASIEARFRDRVARRLRADGETGIFAVEPIAAGDVLIHRWHDDYYRGMVGWALYALSDIDAMGAAHRAAVLRYGLDHEFGLIWGPMEGVAPTTLDNFINHACEPNLAYDDEGNVVSRCVIDAGCELRLDYGGFVVNYDEPFTCACGAPSCRRRVSRDDWRVLAARSANNVAPFVRRRFAAL